MQYKMWGSFAVALLGMLVGSFPLSHQEGAQAAGRIHSEPSRPTEPTHAEMRPDQSNPADLSFEYLDFEDPDAFGSELESEDLASPGILTEMSATTRVVVLDDISQLHVAAEADRQLSAISTTWYTNTVYTIKSKWGNRCLDADLGTINSNGTRVQLWDCNGWNNQRWYFIQSAWSGWFLLKSYYNNRCLDADLGTINSNGTRVQLWDCIPGSTNQVWQVITYGSVNFLKNGAKGRFLDADWNTNTNGNKVQLWDYTGNSNQQWY